MSGSEVKLTLYFSSSICKADAKRQSDILSTVLRLAQEIDRIIEQHNRNTPEPITFDHSHVNPTEVEYRPPTTSTQNQVIGNRFLTNYSHDIADSIDTAITSCGPKRNKTVREKPVSQ